MTALAATTLSLSHSAVTWAQDGAVIDTAPQQATQDVSNQLWLYLIALGIAAVMFGIYVLQRARRNEFEHLEGIDDSMILDDDEPHQETNEQDMVRALAQVVASEQGSAPSELALQSGRDKPLFAPSTEGHQKECPQCHRRYASWMVVCPVDATTLKDINTRRRPPRLPHKDHTRLPRKRCPSCGRRYEEGAEFCAIDASKLLVDTLEDAAEAPKITICRTCGKDVTKIDREHSCGCGDEADILTLDPSNTSNKTPSIPLTVCPKCRTYGGFGQTHCAKDGELLIPVTSVQANSLPITGYGPRRKLCRKCGTQFSGGYVYCTHDGTKLTSIH